MTPTTCICLHFVTPITYVRLHFVHTKERLIQIAFDIYLILPPLDTSLGNKCKVKYCYSDLTVVAVVVVINIVIAMLGVCLCSLLLIFLIDLIAFDCIHCSSFITIVFYGLKDFISIDCIHMPHKSILIIIFKKTFLSITFGSVRSKSC